MNKTRPDIHAGLAHLIYVTGVGALHRSSRRQRCVQSRVACLAQQRVQECDALHGFAQACTGSRSSARVIEQAMHPSPLDTSPTGYRACPTSRLAPLPEYAMDVQVPCPPHGHIHRERSGASSHGMHTAAPEQSSMRKRLPQTGLPLGWVLPH